MPGVICQSTIYGKKRLSHYCEKGPNRQSLPEKWLNLAQQGLSAALAAGYAEKSVQSVILPLEEKTGIKVRISG
jgi:hypothetical protein